MATPIRCPECDALVKLPETLAAGKKVKCPKCGTTFLPEDADEEPPRSTAVASRSRSADAAPRAPRSRMDRDDEDDDRPRRPRQAQQGMNVGLLIGCLAGVGVLLLVLVVGAAGLYWWRASAANRAAEAAVAARPAAGNPEPPANPPAADMPKNPANPGPAVAGLPQDILDRTRRATAFIRVDAGGKSATGSGFLVKANGDTAYLITNFHVIAVPQDEPAQPAGPGPKGKKFPGPPAFFGKGKFGPPGFTKQPQPKIKPKVTVVLDSGTPDEQSLPADVVAIDDEADLAALRITGVRNLPAALDVTQEAPVAETLPVFIFGFPIGKAHVNPGNPTITIGKGSIAGLRRDDNNELIDVHINGEINPGNSGGPVVDAQGRLIGIAVATVPGKQIGFAVPTAELHQMLKGSVFGALVCQVKQQGVRVDLSGEIWRLDRKSKVRSRDAIHVQLPDDRDKLDIAPNEYLAFARLTDPMHKINGATLHYVLAGNGPIMPNAQGWAPLANAQQIPLKISDQDATGNFKLPPGAVADQTYAFQVSYVNAEGQTIFTQPHLLRLTFPKNPKSVTVKIAPLFDEPSKRYMEDSLPKLWAGVTIKSSRTKEGLSVEIDPVEDPQTIIAKINFGEVVAVEGRTITVVAKKIDLPLPTAAEVAQALEDLRSADTMRRTSGADRLAKAYAPLPDRRVEVAKALEALVTEKEFWLRQAALRALTVWAGPENVAGLVTALTNDDLNTRRGIVTIIARYKDPAAAPALATLLPSLAERADASAALKAIGPAAEKAVIPYLTHKDAWAATEACHILKEIGTAESVAPLQAVLKSNPNFMVAPAARDALKSVQSRK